MIPIEQREKKTNNQQMGIHKTKKLCSKGNHQSNEHTTQWGKKKFPSYTPNRGLVFRIYKKLKNNQTNTQFGHQENKQHN